MERFHRAIGPLPSLAHLVEEGQLLLLQVEGDNYWTFGGRRSQTSSPPDRKGAQNSQASTSTCSEWKVAVLGVFLTPVGGK